jgi:hypothetical protein
MPASVVVGPHPSLRRSARLRLTRAAPSVALPAILSILRTQHSALNAQHSKICRAGSPF